MADESMKRIVEAKIDRLSAPVVRAWLHARLSNCWRLAAARTGADRDGWLDDAAYFAAAVGMADQIIAGAAAESSEVQHG